MEILFLLLYGFLFSWLIYKKNLYRYFQLSPSFVLILFWIKVLTGFAYNFIHLYYYGGGDVAGFNHNGKIIFAALPHSPLSYLKLITYPGGENLPPELMYYIRHMKFWSDKGTYLLIKMLAVFNLFSFGSLWINTMFFQLITMVGLLSLYKTIYRFFPEKKTLIIVAIFFLPQTLFWSSGIHKDGLILTCTGLLLMCAADLVTNKFHWLKLIACLLSTLFLLMMRGYDIMLMPPGLIALYWCYKTKTYRWVKFTAIYSTAIVLFFISDACLHLGFVNFILQKQYWFNYFGKGMSALRPLGITKEWWSFVLTAPHALYRALFRPNVFQFHSWHELVNGIEHTLYLLLCGWLLFYRKKGVVGEQTPTTAISSSLALFCLFYSISMLVFIGWIVPNTGAMVRYTSSAMPFFTLFCVLVSKRNMNLFQKV